MLHKLQCSRFFVVVFFPDTIHAQGETGSYKRGTSRLRVDGELTIKLKLALRYVLTHCARVSSWPHAVCCVVRTGADGGRFEPVKGELPQRHIRVTTASATLLFSGSDIFQVWHMQRLHMIGNNVGEYSNSKSMRKISQRSQ